MDAHADAASPYGVLDLVGNVYQWTVRAHLNSVCVCVEGGGSGGHSALRS